jgi:hypothetical protein
MVSEIPEGLRSDVALEVARILPTLEDSGWQVSEFRWESRRSRTLIFTAKSANGRMVYGMWGESELSTKLTDLLTAIS